jgi:hypothetical protein
MIRPLKFDHVQFGAKVGRHMHEFGRDPGNDIDRDWLQQYILQIYEHPKQIREGTFRGQGVHNSSSFNSAKILPGRPSKARSARA